MSQYYQLTSLEEIYHLYPNLKVDNGDSVQYMVQDEKIIQYTDAQGQETLTAVDNSNLQFSQCPTATQQGVFVIEAIDPQQLGPNKSTTSSDQPDLSAEQVNIISQHSEKMVETQQALVIEQLDQSSADLILQKEVPNSEIKSQCILQMEQNKPQIMNQQPQYVIHPIQTNLVHVDSSKQQLNSQQLQVISQQKKGVNNISKSSTSERTNKKELQQLPVRQLEGNKGAITGQVKSVNNQQQFLMQPIDTSYHKAAVELGTQDGRLIMQQIDKSKQNSFIVQQCNSNNQFANQLLLSQPKIQNNQHTLIQNLQFTTKETQTVKYQNVENPQFKMGCSKQPQAHYQMQHFIVPQGERNQPKVVVQRIGINKQVASAPQFIVQQFQQVTPSQGTQFVVQQLDLNRQQNILPYIISSSINQSASNEIVQKTEAGKCSLNSSHCAEQIFKGNDQEQPSNKQDIPSIVNNERMQKQERNQEIVDNESKSMHKVPVEQGNNRLNQLNQDEEMNKKEPNNQVEQYQSNPQQRLIHQEVNQNHVDLSLQDVTHTDHSTTTKTVDNHPTLNVCTDQDRRGESAPVHGHLLQTSQLVQNEDVANPLLSKNDTESSIQLNETSTDILSMQVPVSSANVPQCRRITLKHNESQSYPAGVFIIPRGNNQTFISPYPPGIRVQPSQTMTHTLLKQTGGDCKTNSNDKGSQTCDLTAQNVILQQDPTMILPADSIGVNQQAVYFKPTINAESLDPAATKPGEMTVTPGMQQSPINRIPNTLVLTPQQKSESVNECDKKELIIHPSGQNNASETITTHSLNPSQASLRNNKGTVRGPRAALAISNQRAVLPASSIIRGIQMQTSLARFPQTDVVTLGRKSKGVGNVAVSGWTSNSQDVRNQAGLRPVIYHLASVNCNPNNSNNNSSSSNNNNNSNNNVISGVANINVNNSTNSVSNTTNVCTENTDETRMLVLLPNGEKKLVRFPNTQQNIHIQQLWQQVRFSLGSQISLVSNEQAAEKNNAGQILIKSVALENQELKNEQDSSNVAIHNLGNGQNQSTLIGQQHRPRASSSRNVNSAPASSAFKSRTQSSGPRMPTPRVINPRMVTPPLHQQHQSNALSGVMTQMHSVKDVVTIHHPKEAPKFIPGQAAICPFCGISSLDFNKCIRCRRKLPPNVKSQSIFTAKKKNPEKTKLTNEELLDSSKPDPQDKNSENLNAENKEKTGSPLSDKKKPKPSPKKKKIADEPAAEILILSSDEEEENNHSKLEISTEIPALLKEPICETAQLTEEEMAAIAKEPHLADDFIGNVQSGTYTTFHCRAVRIGSYKTQLIDRLLFSTKGVQFVVTSLKSENVTIYIPTAEILKILINFGKQMPIIFMYTTPKMGYRIRSQLGMESMTGPYYDPAAVQEETHKRLTFLLEKVSEDNKIMLHNMFPQGKLMEELSEKEANEILVKASPVDEHSAIIVRPIDAVKKIMIYPPPPEKGGIPLNNQDYACLGEDQFLNDVIIDFYLKYLLLKVLSPEDRERTHVFSTFFYKRLTTKPKTIRKGDPENDPKLSPAEKRHMRVKGWTKQVNLFEKDFIIVPINEHAHWFLAIICFPGLNGPVKFSDNSPVEPEEISPKKNTRTVQIGNTTITHIIKTERHALNDDIDVGSDRDEADGDQEDLHRSSDDEESEHIEEEVQSNSIQVEIPLISSSSQSIVVASKEVKPRTLRKKTFKEPIKQPCILIFDSLAGASRVRVVATLRDYLKVEYKKKMGHEREFTKDTIKGAVPKVPQQNNFTDCGLYVLQYVESFFQDPLHDFKLPLRYLQDWFPEEVVSCKRQELACLIRSLMEEQGIKVDEIGLPNLTFTNNKNSGEKQAKLEEEEQEDMEEEDGEEGGGGVEKRKRSTCEENKIVKCTSVSSEVDNDEEEEMDIEQDEEEESEEFYGELDMNEVSKTHTHFTSYDSCELDSEGCQFSPSKCWRPGGYYASGSDDEQSPCDDAANVRGSQNLIVSQFNEIGKSENQKGINVIKKVQGTAERPQSVPLAEYQDFESQILCTTIEKKLEGITSETRMVISESDDEENCIEMENVEDIALTETIGLVEAGEEKDEEDESCKNQADLSTKKNIDQLKNFISKFSSESSGNSKLKEDVVKVRHVKGNCINIDEEETDLRKKDGPCVKRTFEALKSVRIPKKAERATLLNKRQRIEDN